MTSLLFKMRDEKTLCYSAEQVSLVICITVLLLLFPVIGYWLILTLYLILTLWFYWNCENDCINQPKHVSASLCLGNCISREMFGAIPSSGNNRFPIHRVSIYAPQHLLASFSKTFLFMQFDKYTINKRQLSWSRDIIITFFFKVHRKLEHQPKQQKPFAFNIIIIIIVSGWT